MPATTEPTPTPPAILPARTRVAIIGAGFAGLGMAMRLRAEGYDDFVVLEKADDLGGTWRDNTYPGAACDIPSHLYSFSFAPKADWSEAFSKQPEILDYLRRCTDDAGIGPHIHFGHEVVDARWDDDTDTWRVVTSRGEVRADVLVGAMGPLSRPSVPDIGGLDTFEGTVFHSAQWRHDVDLAGKRVAVVGTGASAIQFVPEIQPRVESLVLFQRTPPWVVPRRDRRITEVEKKAYKALPALRQAVRAGIYWSHELLVPGLTGNTGTLRRIERLARAHLRAQVPDPELRARLTPDYRIGCKRILMSNDYYRALTQPNAEVVASGLREVGPRSVVAADGTEREVDVVIFGTGFQVTDYPGSEHITGREGRTLQKVWAERGMAAYLGATIDGFPNAFLVIGPNTGLGHNSMVFMMEAQMTYVVDFLRYMDRTGMATAEVRPQALSRYNDELQGRMANTVWSSGGCSSWYLDERGNNPTLWPDFTWKFRARTRRFDPQNYTLRPRRSAPGMTPEPTPDTAPPTAADTTT